jgi:hypothetical protein
METVLSIVVDDIDDPQLLRLVVRRDSNSRGTASVCINNLDRMEIAR